MFDPRHRVLLLPALVGCVYEPLKSRLGDCAGGPLVEGTESERPLAEAALSAWEERSHERALIDQSDGFYPLAAEGDALVLGALQATGPFWFIEEVMGWGHGSEEEPEPGCVPGERIIVQVTVDATTTQGDFEARSIRAYLDAPREGDGVALLSMSHMHVPDPEGLQFEDGWGYQQVGVPMDVRVPASTEEAAVLLAEQLGYAEPDDPYWFVEFDPLGDTPSLLRLYRNDVDERHETPGLQVLAGLMDADP